jgi:uracil-DNA glycosylase
VPGFAESDGYSLFAILNLLTAPRLQCALFILMHHFLDFAAAFACCFFSHRPSFWGLDPLQVASVSGETDAPGTDLMFMTAAYLPTRRTLPLLRTAVQSCKGCDLYLKATQAVFGEGPGTARMALVGEQPGNEEDLQGHPFVGPAGGILDRALAGASIERADVYVTNAVKHFKFEERGKRRLHQKPRSGEVRACQPWLEAEMKLIKPEVIVCLGATAAQTLLGNKFRLTQERGVPFEHAWAPQVVATIHPSAILRAPDSRQRHAEYARFVEDLKRAHGLLRR